MALYQSAQDCRELVMQNVPIPTTSYSDDEHYNMSHKNRGKLIIFHHQEFLNNRLETREGTFRDVANLTETFEAFDFEVIQHKDKTYRQIDQLLKNIARMDHTESDCIAIAILTHGTKDSLEAHDCSYARKSLWSYFTPDKSPSLANKPKLFFIQACRGLRMDPGQSYLVKTDLSFGIDGSTENKIYSLPSDADFLWFEATTEGNVAFRCEVNGSWFIQALCKVLKETNGICDNFQKLFPAIKRNVAANFASGIPCPEGMKQVPESCSTLLRTIAFAPKKRADISSVFNDISQNSFDF